MDYQILENPCELLYKPITFLKYDMGQYPSIINIYCNVDKQNVCFSLNYDINRCRMLIDDIKTEFEANKDYKIPMWFGSHPLLGLWMVF